MFGPFERAVAGRYLRARRGERFVSVIAFFSLIGIALGVATLIIVMSVMNGFRADLLSRILGLDGHVDIYGAGRVARRISMRSWRRCASVPGVVSATPIVQGQALLTSNNGGAVGGIVRGMRAADLRALKEVGGNIREGSLDDFHGDDAIAIGVTLANNYGLHVGSSLTLVSPQGAATAFGTIPRVRAYKVVAIYQAGVSFYDSSYVFLPLEAAQVFFQTPNAVTQIEVMIDQSRRRARDAPRRSRQALAGTPVRIIDWTQTNNSFFTAVEVERNVMFLILTLIILVAAFNIVSSLIMMVKDKTRRHRGAAHDRRRARRGDAHLPDVRRLGGRGRDGGGLRARRAVLPQHPDPAALGGGGHRASMCSIRKSTISRICRRSSTRWEVLQVVVMALGLSLLATLYPSWRAARTDPVEALRHE